MVSLIKKSGCLKSGIEALVILLLNLINIKLYMPPWTNNQLPVQNDSLANYQPVLLNPITSL